MQRKPMKCVVGIDLERRSSSALAWLGKLKFGIEETFLVHVTQPISLTMPYSAYGMLVETDQILDTLREAGKSALADAHLQATVLELNPKSEIFDGYPATELADFAQSHKIDLVAVTSTVRNSLGAVFGGSVARSLTISAKESLLVAREKMPPETPIRAVFATDQSPFCLECMRQLLSFAPKGLSHVTLLTVHEREKHEGLLSLVHHVDNGVALDAADKHLNEEGQKLAAWFTSKGISTSSLVVSGAVEETIHDVMEDTKSDLLIVGSQGHGFIDRVLAGSTALHEVIAEQYPVLLLRHS